MLKEFTNENRNRYYGIRKGDIVKWRHVVGEVVLLHPGDNNRITVYSLAGRHVELTPEHCEIILKVEDK